VYENILKLQDDVSLVRLELDRHLADTGRPHLGSLEDDLTRNLDCMEALLQCAKHQNRIVDDVLQLGKLSMNQISIRPTEFDPLFDAKTCIQRFKEEASTKRIELNVLPTTDYQRLRVGRVSGDPIRFAQILFNLLANAIRFTEVGTINVELGASVLEPQLQEQLQPSTLPPSALPLPAPPHPDPQPSPPPVRRLFLLASVTDSGVGMSTEELSELVQTVNHATPRTYVEYGGSGLGLFISKTLVEAHGGRLSIGSEKNKGTQVSFYISVQQISTPTISTPPQEPMSTHSSNGRVLIVEDNLVSLNLIHSNLIIIRN
jgi:signal transduction histidine kinase